MRITCSMSLDITIEWLRCKTKMYCSVISQTVHARRDSRTSQSRTGMVAETCGFRTGKTGCKALSVEDLAARSVLQLKVRHLLVKVIGEEAAKGSVVRGKRQSLVYRGLVGCVKRSNFCTPAVTDGAFTIFCSPLSHRLSFGIQQSVLLSGGPNEGGKGKGRRSQQEMGRVLGPGQSSLGW